MVIAVVAPVAQDPPFGAPVATHSSVAAMSQIGEFCTFSRRIRW
jgi:hypothetical protein